MQGDVEVFRNIVYDPRSHGRNAKKHLLDVFVPPGSRCPNNDDDRKPVVVFAHGGGWKRGHKDGPTINSGTNVGFALAAQGLVVVSLYFVHLLPVGPID